ncbi:MAG: VWA domain-containing protein [Pseudolabrys sp.]
MQPNGNTNQAIGLQMGWQSLTAAPFIVPAFDTNYKYNQVIILLTDGLNTENRWYTSQSSIDTRQQKTCDNIKAAGITLYTVQVNTGSDPTSTLLRNCASDPSIIFSAGRTSNEIVTTFNQIGTALSNLRLAMWRAPKTAVPPNQLLTTRIGTPRHLPNRRPRPLST